MSDIDECDYNADDDQEKICAGTCRNTVGSFICIDIDEIYDTVECKDGYRPTLDGTCEGSFELCSQQQQQQNRIILFFV